MRSTATLVLVALMALLAMTGVQGFVRGTSRPHSQPVLVTGRNTQLHAVAKKKAAKKKSDVETIRKAELVASIAEKLDCTKAEADASLAAVLGTVTENVLAGKKVTLAGFGSFQLKQRAARKGRNPQTGEEIEIKASKSPGFTAAKAFKEAANE